MSIVVISSYDERFKMVGDMYSLNHRIYCQTHKIDYHLNTKNFDTKYHPSWDKIKRIIEYLKEGKYDYIFWIDADAFFHNINKKILDILTQKPLREIVLNWDEHRSEIEVQEPNNPFMYVSCCTVNGPCLGVFLVRKCQEALDFFTKLYEYADKFPGFPAEDSGFKFMLSNGTVPTEKIAFFKMDVMSSLWPTLMTKDFILHTAGTTNEHRLALFSIFNPYRYIQLAIWMAHNPELKAFFDSFGSERIRRGRLKEGN
jgi:hypothetical protein